MNFMQQLGSSSLSTWKRYAIAAAVGAVLFLPFLGVVPLFDWDEVNFAEASREMLVTGNYLQVQIGFQPFYEKPPMFFWVQAFIMSHIGVSEVAARLPSALTGIIVLPLLFGIGRWVEDERFGFLWAFAYAGSILPSFYFRTGVIDPVFNLLMFASILLLFRSMMNAPAKPSAQQMRWAMLAGLCAGLAVLTKGPVGLAMPALVWVTVWLIRRRTEPLPWKEALLFFATSVLVGSTWFIVEWVSHGPEFLHQFAEYQLRLLQTGEAGHGQPWYYHLLVILFGCFPASLMALGGMRPRPSESSERTLFHWWMLVLLFAVIIVFSMVRTKIVHYSSLAYYPVTFFAAVFLHRAWKERTLPHLLPTLAAVATGLLWGTVLTALPLVLKYKELWIDRVKDAFARGNIGAPVEWSLLDTLPGLISLGATVAAGILVFRRQRVPSMLALFGGTMLTMFLFLPMVVPKVHEHTQGSMVRFFRTQGSHDVYVRAIGFRSYAQYFYAAQRIDQSSRHVGVAPEDFEKWLLTGPIDKPAYFICKTNDVPAYRAILGTEYGEENGYVFFRRLPGSGSVNSP